MYKDVNGIERPQTDVKIFEYYVNRNISSSLKHEITPQQDEFHAQYLRTYWSMHVKDEGFDNFFNTLPKQESLPDSIFDQLFDCLGKTKSPGSPLCYLAATNEQLVEEKPMMNYFITKRIKNLLQLGESLYHDMCSSPQRFTERMGYDPHKDYKWGEHLFNAGLSDPVLLRKKPEPRLLGKMPRLICMVSVNENLIDRLCTHNMLRREQTMDIPTAVALDLTTPEKTQNMYSEFQEHSPLFSTDVQGWEYSTTSRYIVLDVVRCSYIMNLCNEYGVVKPGKENHYYLMLARCMVLCHRVMQVGNELFTCPAGMTSSGSLRTFSQNSNIRSFVCVEADVMFKENLVDPMQLNNYSNSIEKFYIKSGGDDNVTSSRADAKSSELLGFKITDRVEQSNHFDFCSTRFTSQFSYQVNIEKFFTAVMHNKNSYAEKLLAFKNCFVNHPLFEFYKELLLKEAPDQADDTYGYHYDAHAEFNAF